MFHVFSPEPLTAAILKNFTLDKLENLTQATGAAVDAGNAIFFGQKSIQESFDVFDANSKAGVLSHQNSVTFLNDLSNTVVGFDASNDVINAQGGTDHLDGLSGNDILRGDTGADTLTGGLGTAVLQSDAGADILIGNGGNDLHGRHWQ